MRQLNALLVEDPVHHCFFMGTLRKINHYMGSVGKKKVCIQMCLCVTDVIELQLFL